MAVRVKVRKRPEFTPPQDKQQHITIACEAIIKGISYTQILKLLEENGVKRSIAATVYESAQAAIKSMVSQDLEEVVSIHVQLYEHIYARCEGLAFHAGKLRALAAKEKIVGLHKEDNTIEINNEVNVTIEADDDYDLSLLTEEEKKRYDELYSKIVG